MKIGIIGAGRIGSTLGAAWQGSGHDVRYGVRVPERAAVDGTVVSISEAVADAEVIALAIPGKAVSDTIMGLELSGKILLDCTNGGDTPEQMVTQALAQQFPQAYVYKVFNTLGYEVLQQPRFDDDTADMVFVGDGKHHETVADLIRDVGLNPVYVGNLENSTCWTPRSVSGLRWLNRSGGMLLFGSSSIRNEQDRH